MAETKPQTFANHGRLDPLFHFFLLPVFGLGALLSLIHFFAHITEGDFSDHFHAFLLIVLAFALLTAPKLVERILQENLSAKDIKKSIQNWRPDYWRV
jgi:hypothetical protein